MNPLNLKMVLRTGKDQLLFIAIIVAVIGCCPAECAELNNIIKSGPFQGIELKLLPNDVRSILKNASEDYDAVLRGKLPKHATRNEGDSVLNDGGTVAYYGKGYKLIIIKSLMTIGDAEGYIHGPILHLNADKQIHGGLREFSSLRFYTFKQYRKLRGLVPLDTKK